MLTKDPKIAADRLLNGGVVAFATETVWGIGADAQNHEACQRIYRIKGRPNDNPLILHLFSVEEIVRWGQVDENIIEKLAHFMPGPLTVIVKKRENSLFSCGLETVALRVPSAPIANEFLRCVGRPVAAPSANFSGKPSITRQADIIELLEGKVDVILEGPDSSLGLESTVIDLSRDKPLYLRPGMISLSDLQGVLPGIERWQAKGEKAPPSPGMKYRHYAPIAKVRITSSLIDLEAKERHLKIGFDREADLLVADNEEYAKALYSFFADADRAGVDEIWCQTPQVGPLHEALMHRLLKASSP